MNGQDPNNQLNQNNVNDANMNPSVLGNVPSNQTTPSTSNTINSEPIVENISNSQINPINPMEQTNINTGSNINNQQVNPINEQISQPNNLNSEVETLGSFANESINEPIAQPIPGTAGTPYQANSLTGNTVGVGTPTMGQDNINSNGFVEPKKVENIGTVPPPNEGPKKKKSVGKTLFVVFIIVLIAGVAFGVYYFLNISNKTTVNLKEVTIGVGDTLSDNINDYATITGSDAGNCTLNTRNVDPTTIGDYMFTITCGEDIYRGQVKVSDIEAPEIKLNTVYKTVNSSVSVEEFVAECTDPSGCTTTFANETTINSYLQTAGGPYSIDINVTDEVGNSTVATASLYVTPYSIRVFRNCESASSEVSGYQATETTADYLPLGNDEAGNLVYLGVSQRIYTYVFTDADEYNSVIGDKSSTLTFDGVTGQATYDDENRTFQIITDLSVNTLNSEAGGTFPVSYTDQGSYYENLGYTCSNVLPNVNQ